MIIGIAGKIASGKSEVLNILRKRGFYCLNADDIVHDLYKNGAEGQRLIKLNFGGWFLNEKGNVDRNKLREYVFADLSKLRDLNGFIHPLVHEIIKERIKNKKNVAIEASYFLKNGLFDLVDLMFWIERPKSEIKKILLNYRNYSEEMVRKVLKIHNKPKRIDHYIKNDSDLEHLEVRVLEKLRNLNI